MRRLTIGTHGNLTPDEARKLAKDASSLVAGGADPASDKTQGKAVHRFEDFATEWLDDAAKIAEANPREARLRVRSIGNYRSLLRVHVGPVIGRRQLNDIAMKDVQALHHKVGKEMPATANRCLEFVGSVWGLNVSFIHAGAKKVDGNPFGPLTDGARSDMQKDVQAFYDRFVETVEMGRGASKLSAQSARKTEADVYIGQEAIAAGLADRIGTLDDVLAELSALAQQAVGQKQPATVPAARGDYQPNALIDLAARASAGGEVGFYESAGPADTANASWGKTIAAHNSQFTGSQEKASPASSPATAKQTETTLMKQRERLAAASHGQTFTQEQIKAGWKKANEERSRETLGGLINSRGEKS